jgi:hypothetical protein
MAVINPIVEAIIRRARYAGAKIERVKLRQGLDEQQPYALEIATIRKIGWLDEGREPLLYWTAGGDGAVASRDRIKSRLAGLVRWAWRYPRLAAISGLIAAAEISKLLT